MKRQENETLTEWVGRWMDERFPAVQRPILDVVKITEYEDFNCLCGNHTNAQGAYPCDSEGKEVEPTPDEWPNDLYCCDNCGRIFNGDTGEVRGRANWAKEDYKPI